MLTQLHSSPTIITICSSYMEVNLFYNVELLVITTTDIYHFKLILSMCLLNAFAH